MGPNAYFDTPSFPYPPTSSGGIIMGQMRCCTQNSQYYQYQGYRYGTLPCDDPGCGSYGNIQITEQTEVVDQSLFDQSQLAINTPVCVYINIFEAAIMYV